MKKHVNIKALLSLIITMVILAFGVMPVKADHGPKPSIDVKIKNAPAYKYVTILKKGWDAGKNSALKVENLEKTAVEEYLSTFSYEGYVPYLLMGRLNVEPKNQDDAYTFGYFVPNPFKVLLIAEDGTIYISPELAQKEYNCEVEYDVSAGTLTEKLAGKLIKRIVYILVCFAITIALELFVLRLFRYPFTKANIIRFFAINAITQLALNVFLALSTGGFGMFGVFSVAEILIAIVEGIFYSRTLETEYNGVKRSKGFIYGIVANAFSCAAGFLIAVLVRGTWGWF